MVLARVLGACPKEVVGALEHERHYMKYPKIGSSESVPLPIKRIVHICY